MPAPHINGPARSPAAHAEPCPLLAPAGPQSQKGWALLIYVIWSSFCVILEKVTLLGILSAYEISLEETENDFSVSFRILL